MMILLTVTEAASLVKMSPDTIRNLIHRGRLAAYRVAPHGQFRIEQSDLLASLTRVDPERQRTAQADLKRMGDELLAKMRAEKRRSAVLH